MRRPDSLSHQVAEDPWMPQANAMATLGLQILKHTSVRWGEDQDPELFLFGLYILPAKSCDIGSNPDLGSLELFLKVGGISRIVSVDVSGVCVCERGREREREKEEENS